MKRPNKRAYQYARFIVLPSLLVALLGLLLSQGNLTRPVQAFSSGPPGGYTGAPGEEPEACAECHVPPDAGTGQIVINVPPTYVPGQTYAVSVVHTNPDPTRMRWGFELTVLDPSDEKAGELHSLDGFTQILNNQGPGSARQYIEHTLAGTFAGQQNGASWTFNWTAPPEDVGPVIFYAAGNHANNDGNTSGDYIYRAFSVSVPFSNTPDFNLSVSPGLRTVVPGGATEYQITITPVAGFTGTVNLSISGLPSGVSASFTPASVNITDSSSRSSVLSINTGGATPLGDHMLTVAASAGTTMHSAPVTLRVVSPSSVDLALAKTASPNPGQVGLNLSYRITVQNNGPATATNINLTDNLPPSVAFVSSSSTQGSCSGTGPVTCDLGALAPGSITIVTIVVTPNGSGQITNSANASASQTDFDTSNNTVTVQTVIQAAAASPTLLDSNLTVATVINGLDQPTSMAFLNNNDFLVLEKATGKVQRVVNGALQGPVLDLPVNSFSERGLLGIALHPRFVENGYVYLFWSESNTGADTSNADSIALLGNRVDRYVWNGFTLTFDRNLIRLRSLQQDANQPSRGNHNGGVLRFGLDGKLYILFGDNGRRGFLQNVTSGGPVPDDQFGGPEPDDAHLTGVILRLNDDGSTPIDNPFASVATGLTGEAAMNLRKVFAYGVRNGFGMGIDPVTGNIWTQENGDDAFDEMNRVRPGFNGGWVQIMGPASRIDQYKAIEMNYAAGNLQQLRWPPSNIADTPQQALARLYSVPGSQYFDPEFSWKYAVAPAALGFVTGRGLGAEFENDMLVGASRTTLGNGYLFRFRFTPDRQHFAFSDPLLADLVADNNDKFDIRESESLLLGRDFGITTDIQTAPNGNVFVVSLSNGAIYEIRQKPTRLFVANLTGGQEVPPTNSIGVGTAILVLSGDETTARVSLSFSGLSSPQTDAHIHGPAAPGVSGPVIFPLPLGQFSDFGISLTPAQAQDLKNGLHYVNVHSNNFPGGEIRGQFLESATASTVQFSASSYSVNEGEGSAVITVRRSGNLASPAAVDFSTADGSAANRTDYLSVQGTLQFAAGESTKSFSLPIVDDLYVEGSETVNLKLSSPTGSALLGAPNAVTLTILDNDTNAPTTNPLEDAQFFVRQHYLDFLNREPDAGGLAYWTSQITSCGTDAACISSRRISVSASFFIETEFQESGSFVYRLYKAALGRQPSFAEFNNDRARVIGGVSLEANRAALADAFVLRNEFLQLYPSQMTNTQFVNKLFDTAGLLPFTVERQQQIDAMNAGKTRAAVLRDVADIQTFRNREYNPSFVLMEYFGYLRRDAEPDGYNFWLDVITNREPNNYRGMVCSFITSREYQERFSPVVPRSNLECRGVQ